DLADAHPRRLSVLPALLALRDGLFAVWDRFVVLLVGRQAVVHHLARVQQEVVIPGLGGQAQRLTRKRHAGRGLRVPGLSRVQPCATYLGPKFLELLPQPGQFLRIHDGLSSFFSFSRQRALVGPMLATGIPILSAI